MKDIYLERNKLRDNSIKLRSAKFEKRLSKDETFKLNEEQTKIYKKFKFYDDYLKAINKEVKKEK